MSEKPLTFVMHADDCTWREGNCTCESPPFGTIGAFAWYMCDHCGTRRLSTGKDRRCVEVLDTDTFRKRFGMNPLRSKPFRVDGITSYCGGTMHPLASYA